MPGVVVTTTTRSGPAGAPASASGQAFFVGMTERGSTTDPILLTSMADVEKYLGLRPTFGALYDQLNIFFSERGSRCYVARVVGAAATKGFLSLSDRAGTPVPTLKVEAANAGAWSSRLKVEVRDGNETNTFRIIVTLDGVVVEDNNNLTSPADAVAKFGGSPYVLVSDLASASVAPQNNPKVLAATVLSAGADDRASVTSADHVTALGRFPSGLGDGAVAIPGQTGSTVWAGIQAHCEANNRIGIIASAAGASKAQLITDAASLGSEHLGLFAPWISVSDGGYGTRTISPEGYVAAVRSRAHTEVGPWRAPAGKLALSRSIIALPQTFTTTDANDLDGAKVNVIRQVGQTFRLYGWNSTSRDRQNYAMLKDRDVLNRLVVDAGARLEQYVFEPIDGRGQLLSAIKGELVGMLEPLRAAGGLFEFNDADGNQIDPGYRVDVGSDVNTPETLFANEVHARILVRISPVGALIALDIVKVGFLGGF